MEEDQGKGKKPKLLSRPEYDDWLKTIPRDVCTFCRWKKYQIVLREFKYWVWIANIAPYWKWHTMIISKRHFEKYSDMTSLEAGELTRMIDYGEKKIIDSKLRRDDGSLVEKVVYFWRYRANRFDPISGTIRPDHFHIHLCCDKDRRWDSTIDDHSTEWDVEALRR